MTQAWSESSPCDQCGRSDGRRLFRDLDVVRCVGCGLVYLRTRLAVAALPVLYGESYFRSDDSENKGYDDYLADKEKIIQSFNDRLVPLEKRLPGVGRVLDIGAATGFFLLAAKQRGWEGVGVEISEFASRYAREQLGLDVRTGTLESMPLDSHPFDLITIWDAIEHVPSPRCLLSDCMKRLRPCGLLALTTPDIGSLPGRLFGRRWMGIKPNEHLFYFDRSSIRRMLIGVGFEIESVRSIGKIVSFDFFLKRLGQYSAALERVIRFVAPGQILRSHFYVNPLDIMIVLARKPAQ